MAEIASLPQARKCSATLKPSEGTPMPEIILNLSGGTFTLSDGDNHQRLALRLARRVP